jgi:vacuolar protein sorting-associated protein 13B
MFKLESYITPIILSYVDKYVKNIKAEQSQVSAGLLSAEDVVADLSSLQLSLWGGDAVFSNLDLRLDVLEQELRLPFTFVSGHIHELQIHVPWTRLHAEPIVITINTIGGPMSLVGLDNRANDLVASFPECVLKLPTESDPDTEGSSSLDSSSVVQVGSASARKKPPQERKKQKEETAAPPGYVQSLVNKIISNVCVVCNNLILKVKSFLWLGISF